MSPMTVAITALPVATMKNISDFAISLIILFYLYKVEVYMKISDLFGIRILI
jgi:hypothetical protein